MTTPPPGWEDILDADEQILWQGTPVPCLRLSGGAGLSVFGLFFAGFAAFWMIAAAWIGNDTGPIGAIFPLFGLPFLLIGMYMLFGRFLWEAHVRRRTWYTLTDKRAYIATATLGQRRLQSYRIGPDVPLELIEGPHDSVYFGPRPGIGFKDIDDGRQVLTLMRTLRKDAA